jgi:hypothetical protein
VTVAPTTAMAARKNAGLIKERMGVDECMVKWR